MSKTNLMNKVLKTKSYMRMKMQQLQKWIKRYWLKLSFAIAIFFMLQQKDLSFQFNLHNASASIYQVATETVSTNENNLSATNEEASSMGMISNFWNTVKPKVETTVEIKDLKYKNDDNWGNTYSNMTYSNSDAASKKSKVSTKKQKQQVYVKRFASVAQSEMKKYGIPASIKLAQGLIESNAGESRLSVKNNNHFGMKCFSKKCGKGHCSNFTDDTHKDFFRTYETAWESYRAHSMMLKRAKRYRSLFKLKQTDYKSWAKGLKKAGYATDKRYAEKLIHIIEQLHLDEFDR